MNEVVLLANQNSQAWNFSKKIQTYLLEEYNQKIPLNHLPISFFRNRELHFDSTENLRKKDVYFIQDSSLDPQQWWVELLLVKDMVLGASANSLTFVLPNHLYARQDKKDQPRVPISARAFAESISKGTDRIITMDLHSGQIQGFYPSSFPLDNLYSFPELVKYLISEHFLDLTECILVSPDAGGVTRVKSLLKRLEKITQQKFKMGFCIKERPRPGEVSGEVRYVGPNPEGKNILIIDDILDSGNTICVVSKYLRQKGAKRIGAYATHGLFTKGIFELNNILDYLITSNTSYQTNNGIEVIDVSSVFAEAIYRVQKGDSLSELFE